MDFTSEKGFGVGEYVEELDGLGSNYDHYFDDFDSAKHQLIKLLGIPATRH